MIKPHITEGIIAVANHKLRVEGTESYREYLSKEYYSREQVKEAIDKEISYCNTRDEKVSLWRVLKNLGIEK